MQTKVITHDHRKIHKEIYGEKPGPVRIQRMPQLKYIIQEMNTAYHMDWAGRPEPVDQQWIVWKIVNQLKHITKTKIDYKFKLMPHEIIWHEMNDNLATATQVMQVPDCITDEMFEEAQRNVAKNLKGQNPKTKLITAESVLCVQKLHVGHYRETKTTLLEVIQFAEDQGYQMKKSHREIYLTPAMRCHNPSTWKTIVSVELV
ncbi:hypothetical protein [Fictibacillus arsenicus]|uniref:GyrI-like small molecule binding domain-containing protein n=1 Tax=Fictibacillus arsenicus TaxID=255247 RepID=A0A1V3G7M9_9BACL|nr:hypothetical protein [Fictibacillus arsenicus]OOE12382.1 hypothetical protein UN64_09780 [Fictibacillus arsenicus]